MCTKDNTGNLLGKFGLSGIPLALHDVPQIEVMFNIDVNGICNLSEKGLGVLDMMTALMLIQVYEGEHLCMKDTGKRYKITCALCSRQVSKLEDSALFTTLGNTWTEPR